MPGHRRPTFRVVRAYDSDHGPGGYRVLVDQLWPRGVKKADAELDEWLKDVSPSADLRRWYGHDRGGSTSSYVAIAPSWRFRPRRSRWTTCSNSPATNR